MNAEPGGIRKLRPDDVQTLLNFFNELQESDRVFFHPHPFDADTAKAICSRPGKDVFVAGFEAEQIAAYGMLRGWADGFDVPRIGLATRAASRGRGWGDAMMTYLHSVAATKGASRVELKVEDDNDTALRLYRRHGYVFSGDLKMSPTLIGWRNI